MLNFSENCAYFSVLSQKLYFLFCAMHFLFIPLFYYTGIPELVVLNAFSGCLYLIMIWINSKGRYGIAFSLLTIEVFLHAYFCSIYIGDAGFSDAVMVLPVLFFVSPYRILAKIIFFFSVIAGYILLVINDQLASHIYEFSNVFLGYFEILTAILIVVIDSYIAYYAFKIIKSQNSLLNSKK